jgi:hypothetical protein
MRGVLIFLFPFTLLAQTFTVFSNGPGGAFCPTCIPYIVAPPVQYMRQTSGSGTTVITVQDTHLNHSTSATLVSDWASGLSLPLAVTGQTYSSDNTAVATVDQNGYASWVSNGTANISLSFSQHTWTVPLTFTTTGSSSNTFNSWVTGSLGANATSQIETAITGITTYSAIQLFSSMTWVDPPSVPSFVRNAGCWAQGLTGITAIAVGYITPPSDAGTGTGITAIAPDIAMTCAHSHAGPGMTIYFCQADNTTVARGVLAGGAVPNSDIYLYRLDSALPSGIAKMPFAPANLLSYIPGYTWGVPMFCINGAMNPLVSWWNALQNIGLSSQATVCAIGTDTATVNLWTILHNNNSAYLAPPAEGFIAGDSGHVGCLVINGALVAIMTGWTSGSLGPSAFSNISAINAEISALGSSSTVTVANLTGFPTY